MKGFVLCLSLLGCAPGEPGATTEPKGPTHAPGTVLLVEEFPLVSSEVDRLSADISDLYPEYSRLHARRLALTNEFLPRMALRANHREAWAMAKASSAAADDFDSIAIPREGNFVALGLGLWSAARHLTLDVWSPPVELVGRWVRVRLDEKIEHADPRQEQLRITLAEFPLLDSVDIRDLVDTAIDRAQLTLLDPGFAEAVPEAWKHRMRASKP